MNSKNEKELNKRYVIRTADRMFVAETKLTFIKRNGTFRQGKQDNVYSIQKATLLNKKGAEGQAKLYPHSEILPAERINGIITLIDREVEK